MPRIYVPPVAGNKAVEFPKNFKGLVCVYGLGRETQKNETQNIKDLKRTLNPKPEALKHMNPKLWALRNLCTLGKRACVQFHFEHTLNL